MSRVLVLGGYGGFGSRLSWRLATAGHEVFVAGRNGEQAAAFAVTLPGARGVVADRDGDLGAVLFATKPALVIDAAGPFQGSHVRVVKACAALGIHYLDLADARDFVSGIGRLNGLAHTAGVCAVSGASSVPALSGAVARDLARGLDRVSAVEVAISASSRSVATHSVTAAIFSYAGHPIRLWRGGRWTERPGCSALRWERFEVAGTRPLARRLVGLCDVPDHTLLPAALPGRPAVMFRAGSDLALAIWGVWLASLFVRRGWLGSLSGATGLAVGAQRAMRRFGSKRSAMKVELKGWDGEAAVTRRWTLIAEEGDGPEVPTLAAQLIAEAVLAGRVPAGARDAGGLLTLADFAPLFAGLTIRTEIVEERVQPLYRRVIGARFSTLPTAVRAMHLVHGDAGAEGEAVVRRGGGWLGRLIGWFGGFPPAGDFPLHVHFEERGGVERWSRRFGPHRFASELSPRGALLQERFGAMRFAFALPADERGLSMQLRGWSVFGIPLPLALAPRIAAREWQEGKRFRFEVDIAMPLLGPVVYYTGWLKRIVVTESSHSAGIDSTEIETTIDARPLAA